MKLKYYLRGLGIGIIVTTLILMIAFSQYKNDISDAEIIKRAQALGMVMKEDSLFGKNTETEAEVGNTTSTEDMEQTESEFSSNTETIIETEQLTEIEQVTEVESETEQLSETETEAPTETERETETETENNSENVGNITGEVYHLVISPGALPRLICAELEENGVITDAASLRQYLTDVGFVKSISIGEYDIPYGASNEEVYQILKAGPLNR